MSFKKASERCPIAPKDIILSDRLWDSFGKSEREATAHWLIKYMQSGPGTWRSFKPDEVSDWAQKNGHRGIFLWNGLLDNDHWIRRGDDGLYVTTRFVALAWSSNPAEGRA